MVLYIIELIIKGRHEVMLAYAVESSATDQHLFYEVYHNEKKLGNIFPEFEDPFNIEWHTADLISYELVEEIGKQIVGVKH